jgi:hypothetical protein
VLLNAVYNTQGASTYAALAGITAESTIPDLQLIPNLGTLSIVLQLMVKLQAQLVSTDAPSRALQTGNASGVQPCQQVGPQPLMSATKALVAIPDPDMFYPWPGGQGSTTLSVRTEVQLLHGHLHRGSGVAQVPQQHALRLNRDGTWHTCLPWGR